MDTVNSAVESKSTPAQRRFVWPLIPGAAWEQTITIEQQQNVSSETRTRVCQVTGEEAVTVAAGRFQTVKTVCREKKTNEVVYQLWYAPDVRHWVKEWSRFPWGKQNGS